MEPNQMPPQHTNNMSGNNGLAILAYIGILVIIPLIVAKDNAFVKFHSKQGLVLLITWFIANFLWVLPIIGWIAVPLLNLACFVLMIIGIINAAGNKQTELPVIGQFSKYFNF